MKVKQPRVFQIGFNKCATNAFTKLFDGSGIKSLHYCGKKWRKREDPEIVGRNPQVVIHENIRAGRRPVEGLDSFKAFFDLEYSTQDRTYHNFLRFRHFAAAYPFALFILNTRDRDDWLRSRARHADGRYLAKWAKRMGLTEARMLDVWAQDFDNHHRAVKAHFAREPHRLLVFDIGRDDPQRIFDFFAPWYDLNQKKWKRRYVTEELAEPVPTATFGESELRV